MGDGTQMILDTQSENAPPSYPNTSLPPTPGENTQQGGMQWYGNGIMWDEPVWLSVPGRIHDLEVMVEDESIKNQSFREFVTNFIAEKI